MPGSCCRQVGQGVEESKADPTQDGITWCGLRLLCRDTAHPSGNIAKCGVHARAEGGDSTNDDQSNQGSYHGVFQCCHATLVAGDLRGLETERQKSQCAYDCSLTTRLNPRTGAKPSLRLPIFLRLSVCAFPSSRKALPTEFDIFGRYCGRILLGQGSAFIATRHA